MKGNHAHGLCFTALEKLLSACTRPLSMKAAKAKPFAETIPHKTSSRTPEGSQVLGNKQIGAGRESKFGIRDVMLRSDKVDEETIKREGSHYNCIYPDFSPFPPSPPPSTSFYQCC